MMLIIFSCAYLSSLYLLWCGVCPDFFVHFLIGLFVFLLLSFKSSLYIWNISPLSDVCFGNIFPSL